MRDIKRAEKEKGFYSRLRPEWTDADTARVKRLKGKVGRLMALKGFAHLADDAKQFAHIWVTQYGWEKTKSLFIVTEFLRAELGEEGSKKRCAWGVPLEERAPDRG